MMRSLVKYPLFLCLFFAAACNTTYQTSTVQYKDYRISSKQPASNELSSMLKPYADSVNKSMNDIIVVSEIELRKEQPECNLGNLMADAMLSMAKEKYKQAEDWYEQYITTFFFLRRLFYIHFCC